MPRIGQRFGRDQRTRCGELLIQGGGIGRQALGALRRGERLQT
jgi:hypothetical protein